jgi:hypothetical protein
MQRTFATLLCTVALWLVMPVRANAADELEKLLSGSAAIDDEPAVSERGLDEPFAAGNRGESSDPSANYADRATWQTTPQPHAVAAAPHDVHHEPDNSGSISPVPEPSAIVLALAALAYFILFGRRRRI